jgi:hypothetical protein
VRLVLSGATSPGSVHVTGTGDEGGGGPQHRWRKLHLGVDADGFVVVSALTDSGADDACAGASLLEEVEAAVARFTADGAYDSRDLVRPEGAERRP